MTPLVPLVLCWLVGSALLLVDGRRRPAAAVAAATLAAALGIDVYELVRQSSGGPPYEAVTGGWPAGVGIRLRADRLTLLFGALTAAVLGGVLLHEQRAGIGSRLFPALILLLAAGLHGAFLTGDLFNYYVFFELSVVTSFALAAYGYGRAEIRATFTYVAVNLLGSAAFLTGVAAMYHARGTLDLASLAEGSGEGRGSVLAGVLIFVALAVKLGLFPFHGWVPVLYRHARPAVAAAMSGALVNLGAYGLLRIGGSALRDARASGGAVLLVLGALAAVYGTLLALRRERPEEVAAYSAIAHAGQVVLAIGIAGEAGVLAALLVVLSGSLDKATLFLALEARPRARELATLAAAASVAGLPLTAGFLAKAQLVRAAVDGPAAWATAGALLLASLLALPASVRLLRLARGRVDAPRVAGGAPLALAGLSVTIGLWPAPWARLAADIAGELTRGAP